MSCCCMLFVMVLIIAIYMVFLLPQKFRLEIHLRMNLMSWSYGHSLRMSQAVIMIPISYHNHSSSEFRYSRYFASIIHLFSLGHFLTCHKSNKSIEKSGIFPTSVPNVRPRRRHIGRRRFKVSNGDRPHHVDGGDGSQNHRLAEGETTAGSHRRVMISRCDVAAV